MPPKKPQLSEFALFQSRLDNMLDHEHPLVKLAGLIDWSRFDEAYGRFYTQKGRPGLPTRLMAGLHLLKHMDGCPTKRSAPAGWRIPTGSTSAASCISATNCRSIARR
jgi:hypothetical protein